MQKHSWEQCCRLLSGLLLGAGLGCVLCLVPSPLRLLVLAGLAPLLPPGACLGCGLGASGLLLLKWVERRSTSPRSGDNPPRSERGTALSTRTPIVIGRRYGLTFLWVRHTWRVVQPAPGDALLVGETSVIPCRRCGVPAPRSALLRCERCHHLFHPTCCRWIADGREGSETLCQPCWNEHRTGRRRRAFPATCRSILARRSDPDELRKGEKPEKGGH